MQNTSRCSNAPATKTISRKFVVQHPLQPISPSSRNLSPAAQWPEVDGGRRVVSMPVWLRPWVAGETFSPVHWVICFYTVSICKQPRPRLDKWLLWLTGEQTGVTDFTCANATQSVCAASVSFAGLWLNYLIISLYVDNRGDTSAAAQVQSAPQTESLSWSFTTLFDVETH